MVPLKIALWVAGSVSVGAAAATVTGIIDVGAIRTALFGPPQVAVEASLPQAPAATSAPSEPDQAEATDTPEVASLPTPDEPATLTDTEGEQLISERAELAIPRFDILRVEPDGSVLIAGGAPAAAAVAIIHGSRTLTEAVAGPNGDFVAVLDDPLEPGDYQLVLRATAPDGRAVTSVETAIVSIPDADPGDVLALVEAPGDPSRLISTPQGSGPVLVPVEPPEEPLVPPDILPILPPIAETAPNAEPEEEVQTAALEEENDVVTDIAPVSTPLTQSSPDLDVRIEAVEIDGASVFVAGAATPGNRIRVYANDILLGDAIASDQGRFLVEVRRDLPVGDYIIRADVIDPATAQVMMRAAVPFTRAEGERLAAVAIAPSAVLPSSPPSIPFDQFTPDTPIGTLSDTPQIDASGGEAIVAPQALGVLQGPPPVTETETAQTSALVPVDRSVIIRRGDTLWEISRRVYGQGVKYTTIYLANQDQIADPDRIWPGQIFGMPNQADENAEAVHRELRSRN